MNDHYQELVKTSQELAEVLLECGQFLIKTQPHTCKDLIKKISAVLEKAVPNV